VLNRTETNRYNSKKNKQKQIDWISALWIGQYDAREFILFFHPPQRQGNPAHKTAHLQTPHADPQSKVCKRAVFFHRNHNNIDNFYLKK